MATVGLGLAVNTNVDSVTSLAPAASTSTTTLYTVPSSCVAILNFGANIVTNTASYALKADSDLLATYTSAGVTAAYNWTFGANRVFGPGTVIAVTKTGSDTTGTADFLVKGVTLISS